jgi:ZIP family zinc transporter
LPLNAETLAWIVASGLATAVGGAGLLFVRHPSGRMLDALLGFTAGVMLGATVFSLLVPALDRGGAAEVLLGFAAGGAVLAALDVVVPHAHARFREGDREPAERRAAERRAALLLAALTIHNVPEGLAVGVAFAAGGPDLGIPIALAIGIQNVPEGFAAAAPLIPAGTSPRVAAGVAALTGLVEPPAALAAFGAVALAGALLPAALGFAAGAMLYVIVDELIPESHSGGHELDATAALILGFIVMVALDTTL